MTGRVECPVVAIHGAYHPHPVEGVQEPLSRVLRDFRMVVLEKCGHAPRRERHAADAFYAILSRECAATMDRGMQKQKKIRHTREEVADRTQREFEQLDALVRSLGPEDWHLPVPRPETRAPWTIKDALAHIVYWKSHTARVFRGERRPPEARGLDVEHLNQLIYDQWRDRPPADVFEWHRQVHDDIMRTLAHIPSEWFGRREYAPDWPADFDGHSAGHRLKDIEAALRSRK